MNKSERNIFLYNFYSQGIDYADNFAAGWNLCRTGCSTLEYAEKIQKENDDYLKSRGLPKNDRGYIDGYKARVELEKSIKLAK